MKKLVIISILIFCVFGSFSQDQEIPFSLADRDRLIQVEADVKSLRNEMNSLRNEMNAKFEAIAIQFDGIQIQFEGVNQRFDRIDQRMDRMETMMFWGFGMLFSMMLFMLGFIIWDRRTTLAPVKNDIEALKKDNQKMKDVFKEQSKTHPQLAEFLKSTGVL